MTLLLALLVRDCGSKYILLGHFQYARATAENFPEGGATEKRPKTAKKGRK